MQKPFNTSCMLMDCVLVKKSKMADVQPSLKSIILIKIKVWKDTWPSTQEILFAALLSVHLLFN